MKNPCNELIVLKTRNPNDRYKSQFHFDIETSSLYQGQAVGRALRNERKPVAPSPTVSRTLAEMINGM